MASRTTSTSSSRPRPSSSSPGAPGPRNAADTPPRGREALLSGNGRAERPRAGALRWGLLSLAISMAGARAAPVDYRFDPDQTFVTFEVRHFGTSTLRGRIGPVPGDVRIDRAAGTGELRLRIPVGTVDTGVPALDARLKEPDLLAAKEYPEAYYIATRFRFDGDRVA